MALNLGHLSRGLAMQFSFLHDVHIKFEISKYITITFGRVHPPYGGVENTSKGAQGERRQARVFILLFYSSSKEEMARIDLFVDEDEKIQEFEVKPIAGDAIAAPVFERELFYVQRPKFEVFAAASLIHLDLSFVRRPNQALILDVCSAMTSHTRSSSSVGVKNNLPQGHAPWIFESLGAIELVQLRTDPEIGHCKGFQFAQLESAKATLSLKDTLEIAGRTKVLSVTDNMARQESGLKIETAGFYDHKGDDMVQSLTAIMALKIRDDVFLCAESKVTGPAPPYPDLCKIIWLTPRLALAGSGSFDFFEDVKNIYVDLFNTLVDDFVGVLEIANTIANFMLSMITDNPYPLELHPMAVVLIGDHGADANSSIYNIERVGDLAVKCEPIDIGGLSGSGTPAMVKHQESNLYNFDIDDDEDRDNRVAYGKSYVLDTVKCATRESSACCGGEIRLVHISSRDGGGSTMDLYVQKSGNYEFYMQFTMPA